MTDKRIKWRSIFQAGFFLAALLISFSWTENPVLNLYTLQLAAILLALFLLLSRLQKQKQNKFNPNFFLNIVILTMISLLLIFSTGGAVSPLFFLAYFLVFVISLFISPFISIVFAGALGFCILFSQPLQINTLTAVASLFLMSPLAYLLGRYFLQFMAKKGEIKILAKELKKQEKNIASEESSALLWLSLDFEETILSLLDFLQIQLSKPQINNPERQKISRVYEKSKKLLQSGRLLKEKIDEETDK